MRSIRLEIEDSVFDKVIDFLKHLPSKDIVIIENKDVKHIEQDGELIHFSNHSASQIDEWRDKSEDDIWK